MRKASEETGFGGRRMYFSGSVDKMSFQAIETHETHEPNTCFKHRKIHLDFHLTKDTDLPSHIDGSKREKQVSTTHFRGIYFHMLTKTPHAFQEYGNHCSFCVVFFLSSLIFRIHPFLKSEIHEWR